MAEASTARDPLLVMENVEVVYNHVVLVLKGVSLEVQHGGIVALLGGNGAGKSTTLKSISGLLTGERGEITRGYITYQGEDVSQIPAPARVEKGLSHVMEGRRVFEHLTVEENLAVGAYSRNISTQQMQQDMERVYEYFPRLKERRRATAGYTSGGEQQMLALGRALMARPKMILLDEPSMGLAPQLVEEIFEIVSRLRSEQQVTFLVAEQNTNVALRHADFGYILENGRVVLYGTGHELRENADVKEFYLGVGSGEARKSFRDVKHYRRRKRWLA